MPPIRSFARAFPVLLLSLVAAKAGAQGAEPTIDQLQALMAQGRTSSEALTQQSLARIGLVDQGAGGLHSVIETNPDALAIARQLDGERRAGRVRGPLHGIPVLVKDNIDTGDRMLTTAGSMALEGAPAREDAFIVRRLREAGAVLVGKTNLSEWANIRSTHSTSGWSARGGQTANPYGSGRNPCGSSSGSGVAVAASLAQVAIGTETDGSIMCPSSVNGVVGIKPTVGLVSRSGIVPISASQDTAGPMTRSVADAAVVLNVLAAPDPRDAATADAQRNIAADYRAFLKSDGLRGMRIGVARKKVTGYSTHTDQLFEQALRDLKRLGAELVDPADFGAMGEYDEDELEVLLHELKDGLNRYLATRQGVPVRTLDDVIGFNRRNADREMPFFGQELFEKAQAKGPLTDAAYLNAAQKARRLAREGIDKPVREQRLDAIVAPTSGPAWLTDPVNGDAFLGSSSTPAAVAGYPSITVPMGQAQGLPVGLSFVGTAWSEGKLLQLAYAYEQGTKHRKPPVLPTTRPVPLMH